MLITSIVRAVVVSRLYRKQPCQLPAKLCRKLARIDRLPVGYSWIKQEKALPKVCDYLTKGVSFAPDRSEQRYADMRAFIERQEKAIALAVSGGMNEMEATANAPSVVNCDLADMLAKKFGSMFGGDAYIDDSGDSLAVGYHAPTPSAKCEREYNELG